MKIILSMLAVVFTIGLSTYSVDAEAAKRMGSGKSMGSQRQAPAEKSVAAPTQAPAAAGAAGAAAPGRSWMGPVAGLAAGLGLAALASHLGFGEELASMLMMGLAVVAVLVIVGVVMRKRAAAQGGQGQGGQAQAPMGMRYAPVNPRPTGNSERSQQGVPSYKVLMPAAGATQGSSSIGSAIGSGIGSGIGAGLANNNALPAGFDAAGFERNAVDNFVRLQAANDAGNLQDIRSFTTADLYAALADDLAHREDALQKTSVQSIQAKVIAVEEAPDEYVVSVHFNGVMRDDIAGSQEAFEEIWHLSKPRQGGSGWLLSGIQQVA